MEKRKKTLFNLFVSLSSQIVIFILGLIVPRIVLVKYGSDVNGFIGTIGQIFTCMALLEAGISLSARNAFYKPIKEKNQNAISFIASLAKKYYKKISTFYLVAVILLSFVLPFFLKTSVDYWTIVVYVIFEGLSSALSFYYINTWSTFLKAKGDMYIVDAISLVTKILCYGVKIILALNAVNIAYIQIGYFAVSLIQVAIFSQYMKKKFGWIKYNVDVGNAKLPDKNANLISEVAWVVFSSTDMIVLTMFASAAMASVYSVYNMVYTAINTLVFAAYNSVNYHLGQTYNTGNREKYIKLHDVYNSIFVGIICCLMSATYFLIVPFVRLYTSGVNDVEYIHPLLPLFFCMIQILSWSRYIHGNLIGISFRQKKAVKINILEATINLILSIALVSFMGIEGVVIATVVAMPIKVIYCTYIGDVVILQRTPKMTMLILFVNYLIFGMSVILSNIIDLQVANYFDFVQMGLVIMSISIVVYSGINIFINKNILEIIRIKNAGNLD